MLCITQPITTKISTVKKIILFGNSGAGKSTLAQKLAQQENLAHLDLDTLAWAPTHSAQDIPQRAPIEDSAEKISQFRLTNHSWVIEGCYSDLLALTLTYATEVIFLNLPIKLCIENAKSRPWEPHKYPSKEAQDKNLPMLIRWIEDYATRNDEFSLKSHTALYEKYQGNKSMITSNEN